MTGEGVGGGGGGWGSGSMCRYNYIGSFVIIIGYDFISADAVDRTMYWQISFYISVIKLTCVANIGFTH